jgi:Amt family ammonium transporter
MYSSVNTIWVLLGAALVFFMQAGFAMCEAGFTRAKNSGNILMKNLMDFSIGTPIFWLVGFGLMFGSTNSIIGWFDPTVQADYSSVLPDGVPLMAFLIFQTVFCATASTIVSGAMAERTKFSAYCIYSLCISLFIYPISGHWIWGGGWLAQLGFHDFAGSTAVHMVGGVCALVGASILGPRIGKYGKDGKPRAIPGHNLPLAALGVFILWFAWFGFNGCSTVSMDGDASILSAASVFVTTNMCPAVACVTCMIFTWIRYKKPDVSMTYNAALAGLVGITAGCDMVSPLGAAIMGIIMGIVVVLAVEFFDKKLKVDDPVGAVSVHGVCGALGTICVGLFATDGGLFYGGGVHFLLVQILGVVVVAVYVAVLMGIVFLILKHTIGLRVSEEEELAGMDASEHNLETSYADFVPMPVNKHGVEQIVLAEDVSKEALSAVPVSEAIPVTNRTEKTGSGPKLTKVVVITKPSRLDKLKNALEEIGIAGITVTNVLGCGVEKGRTEYYRGVEVDMTLRPKIQMEMVVSRVPVETVVETCRKTLYTGHIGDGKIFVSDIEDVIKVRTGATGYDALQDED